MKRCAKCGTEHPADTEHFGVDNKRHDGLNVWCKRCLVEGSRASRRRNAEYVKAAAKQEFQMRQKAKAAARAKWLDIARKAEAAPLVLALLLAAPAAADEQPQGVCAERAAIVEALARQWDETRISLALSGAGSVIEIYASPAGTWSAVVTKPNGQSCVVESGTGWEAATPQPQGRTL